jgi:hypothetical protein
MTTFTIDTDNNITAHATAEAATAVSGSERFTTAAEFAALAANWPAERLVAIWNSLPGVSPMEGFRDGKTALVRIWKRIQGLGTPEPAKKATKKANPTAPKPHAATVKGKSAQRPNPAKKAPKYGKKDASARLRSKTAQVIALLQKPKGATLAELMKATGWLPHSVRGFISGALGKKMGLKVESTKREDGERVYSISH